jgi:prophage antirepressor-like protein
MIGPAKRFVFEGNTTFTTMTMMGLTWMLAKEVCAAAGLRNISQVVARLDPDDRRVIPISDAADLHIAGMGRGSSDLDRTFISEGGVYTLILRGKMAMVPGCWHWRFRRWLTHTVLPQIRETGRYVPEGETPAQPDPASPILDRPVPIAPAFADMSTRERLAWWRMVQRTYGEKAGRAFGLQIGIPLEFLELVGEAEAAVPKQSDLFNVDVVVRRNGKTVN